MEVFIEKFCRRYNLSETDVKALTEQMQEVRFRKKEAIVIEGDVYKRQGKYISVTKGPKAARIPNKTSKNVFEFCISSYLKSRYKVLSISSFPKVSFPMQLVLFENNFIFTTC